LLPVICSRNAEEWYGKGCIAFFDKKWLSGGLWREGDAARNTWISEAVSKALTGWDNGFQPREGWPDTAADHRGISAVRMPHDSDALYIHPSLQHGMLCIPLDCTIDGKRDVRRAVTCLIGIMCHIPKVFSDSQSSSQTTTIAPDVLDTDGDVPMGCQVFCLSEVGIDIPARSMGNDNNRLVFPGKRVVNTKRNRSFFAKCAALSGQLELSRFIATRISQIHTSLHHIFIDPLHAPMVPLTYRPDKKNSSPRTLLSKGRKCNLHSPLELLELRS